MPCLPDQMRNFWKAAALFCTLLLHYWFRKYNAIFRCQHPIPLYLHFMRLNQGLTLVGSDWGPTKCRNKFPSSRGIAQNSQINAKLSQVRLTL